MHATSLDGSPASVSLARRFVTQHLIGIQVDDEIVEVVQLLTSELVTNAMLHAGNGVELVVSRAGDRVRVEVHDCDPTAPTMHVAADDAASGRGIFIVDALAADWGVQEETRGKSVWFEIAL